MKQALTAQSQQETKKAAQNADLSHLAVRAVADHEMSSGVRDDHEMSRFGHDFSQASVRPGAAIVGRNYGTASCPVFPRTCPFGGACHTCPTRVQTKLQVSQPGDEYEQEADRIAEQMILPAAAGSNTFSGPHNIQRIRVSCPDGQPLLSKWREEEEDEGILQTQTSSGQLSAASPFIQAYLRSLQGQGQPLSETARTFFEPRFGYDFDDVRIHTGTQANEAARAAAARAFTIGRDVVFGTGQYAPDTIGGQRLLAHELVHVTQQIGPLSHQKPTIQRQAAGAGGGGVADEPQITVPGLIVEDRTTTFGPGQMHKSEFLAELRMAVCQAAEAEMAGTNRTTRDCPYLEYWFAYYGGQSAQHVERAIHKYAQQSLNVSSAREYIPIITARVRASVATWVSTGQITGIPEGLPANPGSAGSDQGEGSSPTSSRIQPKADDGGARSVGNPQAVQSQLGEGYALDNGVRSRMESVFGRSFSQVRVHTDATASTFSDRINARAFTIGEHIAFGSSEYQPGSVIGDAIIAHELAHVMQQGSATNGIAPGKTGQESYDQFEEDADQSAVAATISLWGRSKRVLNEIAQNIKPRLKSGLQLQACRRTVSRCPRGLRWAVVGQPTATGPVCVCAWRCLPPGVGYSLSSGSGQSSGPAFTCANRDRFGRCPGEPNYVTVDEDYEVRQQGTVVGVGAHMSPLGGQAACGCLPLDIEGDPTGGSEVHAPLLAPGLDITNLAGMRGRPTRDPRTGVVAPGGRTTAPPPTTGRPPTTITTGRAPTTRPPTNTPATPAPGTTPAPATTRATLARPGVTSTAIPRGTPPIVADAVARHAAANGGAARPGFVGGGTFANDGRAGGTVLPRQAADGTPITYREYDIHPYTQGVNRGAERVVIGSDGRRYYTNDHYSTFVEF